MARLSNNSLSYMGVASATPPNYFRIGRAPTSSDYKKFKLGDIWHQEDTQNIWMLTDVSSKSATWTDISADLVTDLTITPGDLTITDGDIYIDNGGIVLGAITWNSVLKTLTDGTVYGLPDGYDGEILISGTGLAAAWGNITSTGATVTITNSPNGINLEAAGGTAANTYTADDANAVVPTAGGNINVAGGTNINTVGTTPNTVIMNLDDTISLTDLTLSGDLTVNVDTHLIGDLLIDGDIAIASFTEGVLISDASGDITSLPGTAGQILTSNGAGALPTWKANNDSAMDINTQAGNYTLILGDAGKEIQMTSATAATLTIPLNATTAFEIGTQFIIVQYGADTITITPTAGVTINSVSSMVDTYEQYSAVALIKQDTDVFLLVGDLK